jgi:hypothetical protein
MRKPQVLLYPLLKWLGSQHANDVADCNLGGVFDDPRETVATQKGSEVRKYSHDTQLDVLLLHSQVQMLRDL